MLDAKSEILVKGVLPPENVRDKQKSWGVERSVGVIAALLLQEIGEKRVVDMNRRRKMVGMG